MVSSWFFHGSFMVLSFFFHLLSWFFHLLSRFFHSLSFSFSLLGAQNLIFWSLNFVTISLHKSSAKKSIFGPISGGTPLGPFFLVFLLLPLFVFFLAFDFFISHFFHFFIFESFSFSFSFSLKKKVSSFLFSCISFKHVPLLALVSEFNCFLRSRCSMEMWCPDDIGRESWDWAGRLLGRRACSNSPEWGGDSSPVKTEPPQIVSVLLLDAVECVCMYTSHHMCTQLPAKFRRADMETWACACHGNLPTPVLF